MVSFRKPLVKESVWFNQVEIDLVNGKTDRVIGNRYEQLVLDKVMRNRK